MKTLDINYNMSLQFSVPVVEHYFVLRCVPVSRPGQTVVARKLTINPDVPVLTSRDIFGNVAYRGLINEAHNQFSFETLATVQVDRTQGSREYCLPLYKYSSGLTFASDEMKIFLSEIFHGTKLEEDVKQKMIPKESVLNFGQHLTKSIYEYLTYEPGCTSVHTNAKDVFELRKGVCQDYAHLFCALSIHAGIPCRYVCGTTNGEGTTHAWAEIFVPDVDKGNSKLEIPGRWFGFDPTRNKKCDDDYVILSVGRDYNDCQVDRGIFRGNANQMQTVFVKTICQ